MDPSEDEDLENN